MDSDDRMTRRSTSTPTQPIATIRSIGTRARRAISSGTRTSKLHLAQRVAQLGQRDHLHVLAAGLGVGGDELHVRRGHAQRVEHPDLGRDDRLAAWPRRPPAAGAAARPAARMRASRRSRACARPPRSMSPGGDVLHHARRAAALGVDQEVRARVGGARGLDVGGADARRGRGTRRPRRACAGRAPSRRRRRATCRGRTGSRCPGRGSRRCGGRPRPRSRRCSSSRSAP